MVRRLAHWLLCGCLAAILAGELTAAPSPPPEPALPAEPDAPPPAVWPSMAPQDSTEMVARPLFFASRAPLPPEANSAPAAPVRAPELSLLGTVLSSAGNVAVVRPARQSKSLQLAVGQTLDGWTVSEVAGDRLVLTVGEARHVVPLPEIGAKRPPAAAPAAAVVPAAPPAPTVAAAPSPAREDHPPAPRASEPAERPTYSQSRPSRGRGR